MENITYFYNSKNIDKMTATVARLYLYTLPFRMISPLFFIRNYFGVCAVYSAFIFHIIGLFLLLLKNKGTIHIYRDNTSKLFHYFVGMIIWLNFSSLLMAIIIQYNYGNIGNESAFRGIAGMLVYFTQFIFMVLYNREVFRVISYEEMIKIFYRITIILLILGYMQILVLSFKGVFAKIYDRIDVLDVFVDSGMTKLSLSNTEGATAGNMIGILLLPFIMSRILCDRKKAKYIIILIAWLPVIYFTYSSTAYIVTCVDFIVFFSILLFRMSKRKIAQVYVLLVIAIIGSVFIFNTSSIKSSKIYNEVEYILLQKVMDKRNGSTISRTVPLLVNWGAFSEYPILGVGNGNQGYFYEKYFPEYAYRVEGSDVFVFLERSRTGISNGAVFIPSLLSGYGIIGSIVIIVYIIKCILHIKKNYKELGSFYYVYRIGWVAILLSGFQSNFAGVYYILFVLSIPYMIKSTDKESPV